LTGLCGWALAKSVLSDDEARSRLSLMTSKLAAAGAEPSSRVSGTAACFVRSWRSETRVDEEAGLITAIDGAPRWEIPKLDKIARAKGHAAAVAAAYRDDGDEFLKSLKGQFSVVVIDVAKRHVLLAVDRMGVGRMYYTRADDGALVFGSTADAVAAHPGVLSTISDQGVFDYLFFYVSPAPATIYREQSKLSAGQVLIADADGVRTEHYWRMPYQEQTSATEDVLAEQLRERLHSAVAASVEGENTNRIGAFLSGGLDSSTLVGMLCKQTEKPIKAFTIGFDADGFDEMPYAENAAKHFGATHVSYYLTADDLVDAVPRFATGYDEPFGNSSAVPTYCCARVARDNGVELMIAGDGGDELFAGNERYLHYGIFERYNALPALLRKALVGPAVALMEQAGDTRFSRRARNFLRLAEIPYLNPPEDE
jgi:asparagine synthase (glutamine-hydrolysing)